VLNQFLHELSRVPLWALVMLVNLVAAVACAVWIIHEPDSRTNLRCALVVSALVIIAAVGGSLIALAMLVVHAIEERMWRADHPKPPARRIH
jgi:thiol:disulfide interchange protein